MTIYGGIMKKSSFKAQDITYIAISAVILIICSWIYVPTAIPFTMQSFGVILVCLICEKKQALCAILVYFLLGMFGLPVFAGFRSGVSVLAGPTGGYVLGLFLLPIIIGNNSQKSFLGTVLKSILGMAFLYLFGTLWYSFIYTNNNGGILPILSMCVFPFIIPDIVKCVLAVACAKRINKRLFYH